MARRMEGRETYHRLLEWDKGQAASERLAALILSSEGFDGIDPSHPLGGKDGGKDIICYFNHTRWIGAVYFPRGQQTFSVIKNKFISDLTGVQKNGAIGIAFIANQEITLSQRKELELYDDGVDVRIYHLERIADILNSPKMYGIRLDFLDIEMTKEEQLSYFAASNISGFERIEKKIDELTENLLDKRFSVDGEDIRSLEEVTEAENMFFEKIWFDRHMSLRYRVETGLETVNEDIWKDALSSAQRVMDKYGEENLGPYSDFEWGMINGKLSALRWVLGCEWDMLDT